MTARTPKRKSLLDVLEMAHEMFDGGHPERVPEIMREHLGANNPATDFVVAMWMLTANVLDAAGPKARGYFISMISEIVMLLPEDGGTLADVSNAIGEQYGEVTF